MVTVEVALPRAAKFWREGIKVIFDPTDKELEIARSDDLWELWNSKRAALLYSVI